MTATTESARNNFVAFDVRPVDPLLVVFGAVMLALDAAGVADLGLIADFGDIGVFRYVLLAIAIVFALAYGVEIAQHIRTAVRRRRVLREGLEGTGVVVTISPAVSAFDFPLHWFGRATRFVVVFKSEFPDAEPQLHHTRALSRSKIDDLSGGDVIETRYESKHPESVFWVGEA